MLKMFDKIVPAPAKVPIDTKEIRRDFARRIRSLDFMSLSSVLDIKS